MTSNDLAERSYRLVTGGQLVVEWSGRPWSMFLLAIAGFALLSSSFFFVPLLLPEERASFDGGMMILPLVGVIALLAGAYCLFLREELIVTSDAVEYRWRSLRGSSSARASRSSLQEVAVYQSPGDPEDGPITVVCLRFLGHGLPDDFVLYRRRTADVRDARAIAHEIAGHLSVPVNDMGLAPSLARQLPA
jgi:hypothetical protein